ncbi:MAG: T9SS type A sorting domain-containing protein [Bacteroidota bacterium]
MESRQQNSLRNDVLCAGGSPLRRDRGAWDGKFLGQNYPNPFAKTTFIPYSLPDSENGVLKITNYEGKTISEIKVNSKSNKVELITKDWANGVYYYTLNIDGKTIDTKKMILIK